VRDEVGQAPEKVHACLAFVDKVAFVKQKVADLIQKWKKINYNM